MYKEAKRQVYEQMGVKPESECCANCRYFIQHYVISTINKVECFGVAFTGHCYHPRLKPRKFIDVCERFERGDFYDGIK